MDKEINRCGWFGCERKGGKRLCGVLSKINYYCFCLF